MRPTYIQRHGVTNGHCDVQSWARAAHLYSSAYVGGSLYRSSTSFGWGKDGNVASVGWQVTLRYPIWRVSSRHNGVAVLH